MADICFVVCASLLWGISQAADQQEKSTLFSLRDCQIMKMEYAYPLLLNLNAQQALTSKDLQKVFFSTEESDFSARFSSCRFNCVTQFMALNDVESSI
jgi:hypothetical protein